MQKLFFSTFFMLTLILGIEAQDTGTLILKVDNFEDSQGYYFVKLFNSKDGFPSDASKALMFQEVEIFNEVVSLKFENIPFGEYAISGYHDHNGNHKLDKYFFGMPKERAAASNNAKGNMGPPKYKDAAFEFKRHGQIMHITMFQH